MVKSDAFSMPSTHILLGRYSNPTRLSWSDASLGTCQL